MGSSFIRLDRNELLALNQHSTIRVLPLLTGDGGEYAITVDITVDPIESPPPIPSMTVALTKFHCLEETDEVGSDEPYFDLRYKAASGTSGWDRTKTVNDIDTGDIHIYADPITIYLSDPNEWLDIEVTGWEEDDSPNDDDFIGRAVIRLERSELLALKGKSTTRTLPQLTGDGGRYEVTVTLSAT